MVQLLELFDYLADELQKTSEKELTEYTMGYAQALRDIRKYTLDKSLDLLNTSTSLDN